MESETGEDKDTSEPVSGNTHNTHNAPKEPEEDIPVADKEPEDTAVSSDIKPRKFVFDVSGLNESAHTQSAQSGLESAINKVFSNKEPTHIKVDLSIVGKSVAKAEDYVYTKYADKPLTEAERAETIEAFNVEMNERFRVVSKYAPELNIATTIGSHAIERMHLPNKERKESGSDNNTTDNNVGRAFRLNQNGEIIGYA